MNLKNVRDFKKEYEAFLRSANVNLGRDGTRSKEAFIAEAINMVVDFVLCCAEEVDEVEPQAKSELKPEKPKEEKPKLPGKRERDGVMSVKPNKQVRRLVNDKGVSTMTASESKRADEELGYAPK